MSTESFTPPSEGIYDSGLGSLAEPNPPVYPPQPVYAPPPGYVSQPVYAPAPKKKSVSYAPLVVYIILVLIWLVVSIFTPTTTGGKWLSILIGLLWSLLWAFFIYLLCKRGHTGWAWFLALFSLVLWAIAIILLFVGWVVLSI